MCRRNANPVRRYNQNFVRRLPGVSWITSAYLVAEPNCCATCAATSSIYDVKDLPALPVAGCLRHDGCGCWLVALAPSGKAAGAGR
jgi:hypothetical protein